MFENFEVKDNMYILIECQVLWYEVCERVLDSILLTNTFKDIHVCRLSNFAFLCVGRLLLEANAYILLPD